MVFSFSELGGRQLISFVEWRYMLDMGPEIFEIGVASENFRAGRLVGENQFLSFCPPYYVIVECILEGGDTVLRKRETNQGQLVCEFVNWDWAAEWLYDLSVIDCEDCSFLFLSFVIEQKIVKGFLCPFDLPFDNG